MDRELRELRRQFAVTGDLNIGCRIIKTHMRLGQQEELKQICYEIGMDQADAWDCVRGHPIGYTREVLSRISSELRGHSIEFEKLNSYIVDVGHRAYGNKILDPSHINYYVANWRRFNIPYSGYNTSIYYEDEPFYSWKSKPGIFFAHLEHEDGVSGPTNRVEVESLDMVPEAVDFLIEIAELAIETPQEYISGDYSGYGSTFGEPYVTWRYRPGLPDMHYRLRPGWIRYDTEDRPT